MQRICSLFLHFNSQPHEEADSGFEVLDTIDAYFNSQPHEEADQGGHAHAGLISHFNSQPHEEADDKPHDIYNTDTCISTHSLTKRLT